METVTAFRDQDDRNPNVHTTNPAVTESEETYNDPAIVAARAQDLCNRYGPAASHVLELKLPEPESELTKNVRSGHGRGWSFTPVNGKRPTMTGWQKAPRETLDQALEWAGKGNVGLRTGQVSAPEGKYLVVVDLDVQKPQYDAEAVAAIELPETVTVVTGGGGRQLYFLCDEDLGNATGQLPSAVDVRGRGGQVVFPGSVHPDTGRLYRWADGLAPDEIGLAELPSHVIELIKAKRQTEPVAASVPCLSPSPLKSTLYGAKALKLEADRVAQAIEGTRNCTLNSATFNIGQLVATLDVGYQDAEAALLEAATSAGLPSDEASRTIASGLAAGIKSPRKSRAATTAEPTSGTPVVEPARDVSVSESPASNAMAVEDAPTEAVSSGDSTERRTDYALTDLGNAERFATANRSRARYCAAFKAWIVWDGKRWTRDGRMTVQKLAKDVVRSTYGEAERETSDEKRTRIAKWARGSEAKSRIDAMIDLARCESSITPEDLDQHPWLLTVNNGVVDLKTGQLRPHSSTDYLTQLAPVDYDPEAQCPLWDGFLNRIFRGQADLIVYVQRLAGYFLTGTVGEETLPIMYGEGANGKTTFVNQLMDIMGNYASPAPPQLLMVRRNGDQSPFGVADLKGKRLVVASESDSGDRLSEGLVKKLTGRDKLKARHLYGDFFEFDPTHKIILQTNHTPGVRGTDEGIQRRLVLVPFEVTIPRAERDTKLSEKLLAESPGILAWAVRGCLDWQAHGLQPPEQVQAATSTYANEANSFRQFFDDRCERAVETWMSNDRIRTAYRIYCRERDLSDPLCDKDIAKTLRSLGCTDKRRASGRGWTGLALRKEYQAVRPAAATPPPTAPDETGTDNALTTQEELSLLTTDFVRDDSSDPRVGHNPNPTPSTTITEEVNDDE